MSKRECLKNHPAADLFPLMRIPELDKLADDIKEHGLKQPIVLFEGKVLDGRNRLAACAVVGVEPRFVEWDGEGGSPTSWVLSQNLHRRHLTDAQRKMVAAGATKEFEAEARERQRAGKADLSADRRQGVETDPLKPESSRSPGAGKSAAKAAAELGVSPREVEKAKRVAKKAPVLADAVRDGAASLDAASALADEPEDLQRELVAAGPKAIRAAARAKRSAPPAPAHPAPAPQRPAPPAAPAPEKPLNFMEAAVARVSIQDSRHYRVFCTATRRAIEATPPDVDAIRAAFAELDRHIDPWANGRL